MRYIVCGSYRTGTSAIVRAVTESSSIPAYIDLSVDDLIRSRELDPAYNPNPWGYFSHDSMFAPISQWIGNTPDGSVMKAAPEAFYFNASIEPLCVVLTSRDPEESAASYTRSFGAPSTIDRTALLSQVEEILLSASNVTLTKINFSDLINNPINFFNSLNTAGWPIDPQIAASTIDPSLKRF
jgi:hypothetical protein